MAYEPCVAFAGGTPVRVPDALGGRLRRRRGRRRGRDHPAHQGDPDRLAGQPDRRRAAACRARGPRRTRREARPLPGLRRDLRPAHLHRRPHLPRHAAGRPRAHRAARRVLQGARDDRLAGRLDLRARRPSPSWRCGCTSTRCCARRTSRSWRPWRRSSAPGDDVDAMVADYDRRRRVFVKGLRETGLECPEPGGAFYAFPSIRSSGLDSETFAERLLHTERVAVVPGNVFGPSGEGHVRCSYATALPLAGRGVGADRPLPARTEGSPVVGRPRSVTFIRGSSGRNPDPGASGGMENTACPLCALERTPADVAGLALEQPARAGRLDHLDLPDLHPCPAVADRGAAHGGVAHRAGGAGPDTSGGLIKGGRLPTPPAAHPRAPGRSPDRGRGRGAPATARP